LAKIAMVKGHRSLSDEERAREVAELEAMLE
jgi:hypothetical protein